MSSAAELVLDARCGTGESPLWSPAEQALYWVDIPAARLHRWDATTGLGSPRADNLVNFLTRFMERPTIVSKRPSIFSIKSSSVSCTA